METVQFSVLIFDQLQFKYIPRPVLLGLAAFVLFTPIQLVRIPRLLAIIELVVFAGFALLNNDIEFGSYLQPSGQTHN